MRRYIHYIIGVLAVAMFSACEHKELCEVHPHVKTVRVVFDWQDAPDANPEGMCVFFYPIDGGSPYRADFRGRDGGEIQIQNGEYRVLCYNNDTEAVLFRNTDDFNRHEGYTREGSLFESIYGNTAQRTPRTHGTEEQPVVISPDMMWGCTASDVIVSDEGIQYLSLNLSESRAGEDTPTESVEQVITLYPHALVSTYTYEVRNVKNLKHMTQVCGSISGMSGSLFFASEQSGAENVTIPFSGVSDGGSSIKGEFYTFGYNEGSGVPHHVTFYVWMDDGQKYAYGIDAGDKFNVTIQIYEAPDKRRVHFIIDGLDLPQPIANGSGFDVSVDDWGIIEEDIIL